MLLGMYTIIALAFVSLPSPQHFLNGLARAHKFLVCIPRQSTQIRTQPAVLPARRLVIALFDHLPECVHTVKSLVNMYNIALDE